MQHEFGRVRTLRIVCNLTEEKVLSMTLGEFTRLYEQLLTIKILIKVHLVHIFD